MCVSSLWQLETFRKKLLEIVRIDFFYSSGMQIPSLEWSDSVFRLEWCQLSYIRAMDMFTGNMSEQHSLVKQEKLLKMIYLREITSMFSSDHYSQESQFSFLVKCLQ